MQGADWRLRRFASEDRKSRIIKERKREEEEEKRRREWRRGGGYVG
jgi:hypothetical protein